jgi:hypothetical protein
MSSAMNLRSHLGGELRRREPDRPLAEDRDGVVGLKAEPMQGGPGGARAT